MNGLLGNMQNPQANPSQAPQPNLGTGMASMAADDIQLRPLWIKAQEAMAMGELPQVDYETWKRQVLQQMQQQQQPQMPQPQAQSLI